MLQKIINARMNSVNPVSWFDIHVSDLDRAKKFYETVFNIQLQDFPIEWGRQSAFPSSPGSPNTSGALVEKKDRSTAGGSTVVYFASQDCTTEENRVAQAGGKVLQPKMSIGEFGFISMLCDSEGNTIGLFSRE